MATIIFVLLWHLFVADLSPLDLHLHGPHTHALGGYSTEAECVKRESKRLKL